MYNTLVYTLVSDNILGLARRKQTAKITKDGIARITLLLL